MTSLLLDEPCLVIQPALVRSLGHLADAALLQQLHYWLQRSKNRYSGEVWVYKTYPEWSDEIGISDGQVRTALNRLEDLGVVVSCQPEAYHRRKWYRIDYAHPLLASPSVTADASKRSERQMEASRMTDRSVETRACNAETTSQTTPQTTTTRETAVSREAQRLADLLADLIEANGSKRPTVGKRWVTTMERMLRVDGRPPDLVEQAIRWCQQDDFWRANILSPDALRRQFDRMRLQAARSRKGPKGLDGVRDYLTSITDDTTTVVD